MIQFIGRQPIENEVLRHLLEEIAFESEAYTCHIRAVQIEKGLEVHFNETEIVIGYDHPITYARALALVKERLSKKKGLTGIDRTPIKQVAKFESLGVMIDCSRNAVLKVETVKQFMRYLALMGYKTLQLYTEDTYELEGYPYFGYMRGSYKKEEIKEIVDYAKKLSMEVIPCIQTLAHLGATLRWRAFEEVMDCENTLLVGEEKTYELIEAMVKHAATHFESRRINIGMDEAHNLGLGKYLKQHGYRERIEIMVEHLTRVVEICRKYEMKPMMWSDMFFRLLSVSGDYDANCDLGAHEVLAKLPKDIQIIFWDYYNKQESHYNMILEQHKKLSNTTLFAGGAWRWRGIVPDNTFSLYVSEQALRACVKQGIQEIFVTAWGDNGGECATFAILPSLVFYAERCYEEVLREEVLASRFETFTGATWEDFLLLDSANHLPDNPSPGRCSVNPSKYLFFQDVLMGLFDKHVTYSETNAFYAELAQELERAVVRNPKWKYIFMPIYLNAKILSLKSEMGVRLQKAYQDKNREAMASYKGDMETLIQDLRTYHQAIRKQWKMENKMSGLEIQDQRMGGLLTRMEVARETLESYIKGEIDTIEELEYERLRFDCNLDEAAPLSIPGAWWHEIISPNRVGRT
ncbi:MAG: beta-N-acetylhexosaminidase [Niameybacter sp.]|uniref:beta-N-acetylhexosaminidase n=1 Tax=Niameybacter sp. TaxID=2033640 RepID=UPI002FC6631C